MRAAACQCSFLTVAEEFAPVAGAEKSRRADPDSNLPGSSVSSARQIRCVFARQIRSVLAVAATRESSSAWSAAAAPVAANSTSPCDSARPRATSLTNRAPRVSPIGSASSAAAWVRVLQHAVDVLSPLAVDRLPGAQVALGTTRDRGDRLPGHAGRHARNHRARDAHAELEPYEVGRPPERSDAAVTGGREAVGGERRSHETVGGGDRDEYAPAQVAGHGRTVGVQARDHLEGAAAVEHASLARRPQPCRELSGAAGREAETARLRREAGRIRDRGHLDGRLGAVEEGAEHLRVEARRSAPAGAHSAPRRCRA